MPWMPEASTRRLICVGRLRLRRRPCWSARRRRRPGCWIARSCAVTALLHGADRLVEERAGAVDELDRLELREPRARALRAAVRSRAAAGRCRRGSPRGGSCGRGRRSARGSRRARRSARRRRRRRSGGAARRSPGTRRRSGSRACRRRCSARAAARAGRRASASSATVEQHGERPGRGGPRDALEPVPHAHLTARRRCPRGALDARRVRARRLGDDVREVGAVAGRRALGAAGGGGDVGGVVAEGELEQ